MSHVPSVSQHRPASTESCPIDQVLDANKDNAAWAGFLTAVCTLINPISGAVVGIFT
jgi:hypothetical protein